MHFSWYFGVFLEYDVFVIPIAKTPVVIKNVIEVPLLRKSKKSRNDKYIRIDIENYEEPTDVPDLDNFDYLKERDGTMREEDGNTKGDHGYIREEDGNIKGDGGNMREEDNIEMNLNYGDDKIVGGREVDINLYPYHVAYGTNCGGAIIDSKWIVTAGHCG